MSVERLSVPASAAPSATTSAIVAIANGQVAMTDGNLTVGFTNQVQLNANNTVVNLGNNALQLKINVANGLFAGKAQDPVTGKSIPFKGVVLQKVNAGGGFFLNQNQSGEIFLGP